jgi:hypothetical protein
MCEFERAHEFPAKNRTNFEFAITMRLLCFKLVGNFRFVCSHERHNSAEKHQTL